MLLRPCPSAALGFVAFFLSSEIAAAQAPCGPDSAAIRPSLKVPKQAAAGNRFALSAEIDTLNSSVTVSGLRLEAPPNQVAGPNPSRGTTAGVSGVFSMTTDAAMPITLTWTQTDSGGSCVESITKTVERAAPITPRLRITTTNYRAANGAFSARFVTGGNCAVVKSRTATVFVRGQGTSRRYSLDRPCGTWSANSRKSTRDYTAAPERGSDGAAAVLFLSARGKGNGRYRVVVEVDGKTVRRATLVFTYRPGTPTRRIYQGTDAFVNYCINRRKKVMSSGGRLYCLRPGTPSRKAVDLR